MLPTKSDTVSFCLFCPENPAHNGAHVLPSTLIISLLLIIIVLLTIYCLRWTRAAAITLDALYLLVCVCVCACIRAEQAVTGRQLHREKDRSGHSLTDRQTQRTARGAASLLSDGPYWIRYLFFACSMCWTDMLAWYFLFSITESVFHCLLSPLMSLPQVQKPQESSSYLRG